jgi:DNA polymerase-3 subunit delta
MARGAAEFLMGRVGTNLSQLLSELEKCSLRAGVGEPVTAAIISEMTSRAPQESIFDLMDALGARNGARALTLLRELMGNGEPPELLLTMLVRHLRQLLQARAFLDARVALDGNAASKLPPELAAQLPREGKENLAVVLQGQSWRGGRLAQQARNFTPQQLQNALSAALDVDLAMKGIENDGGPPEMLLELFLARMC